MNRRVIVVGILLAMLAGCGGGSLVRDGYFGQSWLEPARAPGAVKRDGNGNPILPPSEKTRSSG